MSTEISTPEGLSESGRSLDVLPGREIDAADLLHAEIHVAALDHAQALVAKLALQAAGEFRCARIDRPGPRRSMAHREQKPDTLRRDLRQRAERGEPGAEPERNGEPSGSRCRQLH